MSAVTTDANPTDQVTTDSARVERNRAIWWTIENVALSLWLGGLIVIGAIVAPVAFHTMRTTPILAGLDLMQNTMAGAVVGGSLKVLNGIVLILDGLLVIRMRVGYQVRFAGIRSDPAVFGLFVLASFINTMQLCALFPRMDTAQASGDMITFDNLHHIYVYATYAEIIALVALMYALSVERIKLSKP